MAQNIKPIRIFHCDYYQLADQIGRELFEKYLKENPAEKQLLYTFETKLKRNEFERSVTIAQGTLQTMIEIIKSFDKFKPNPSKLLGYILALGNHLINANPKQFIVSNIVRIILKLSNEAIIDKHNEYESSPSKTPRTPIATPTTTPPGSQTFTFAYQPKEELPALTRSFSVTAIHFDQHYHGIIKKIVGIVTDFAKEILTDDDVDLSAENTYATDHIHQNEIILTYGYSTSVLRYLRAAAIHRNFEVYVVESAPSYCGRKMAKNLVKAMENENPNAKNKKKVTIALIHDNEVYAIMARVNKVIVGANYVTADGGFFGLAGMNMVTLSAKAFAVPVICIVPIYKMCPLYCHDIDSFIETLSPLQIMSQSDMDCPLDKVTFINPALDYVTPDNISLYITPSGDALPSYIYRILAEYYSFEDELAITNTME